jgi:hypothetical protein
MNDPVVDLIKAGSLIMLVFAAVLLFVVMRNVEKPESGTKRGPVLIGLALLLFAVPIYGDVLEADWVDRYGAPARILACIVLPLGLYNLKPFASRRFGSDGEEPQR